MHRAGNRLVVSSNPTSARLWRRPWGVAWDAVAEPIVEYIDPDFWGLVGWSQMMSQQTARFNVNILKNNDEDNENK